MSLKNDMIEIQLNWPPASCDRKPTTTSTYPGGLQFGKPPGRHRGFPYGQYESDLDEMTSCDEQNRWRRKFIGFAEYRPQSITTPSATLDCIRQLYCPDCKQRLDKHCVENVRDNWDVFRWCCLPILPFVQRFGGQQLRRRKVICQRCGSNLGYWKYA